MEGLQMRCSKKIFQLTTKQYDTEELFTIYMLAQIKRFFPNSPSQEDIYSNTK